MKQVDTILQDVNYPIEKLKLVKCVQAHNEADWIIYNLANCYDEFDKIRVLEGAVEGRPGSTPDGHSTDGTLELIKSFPDPDNKIELYTLNKPFKSLEQMKQVFLDAASEDEILCIADADEFFLEGQIERIRRILRARPNLSQIVPMFLHFWRDAYHIRNMDSNYTIQHQRFLRYTKGMRYHSHPVASDANGICTYFDNSYQSKKFVPIPPLYIYHYGHAKGPEAFRAKKAFYDRELAKFSAEGGKTAAQAFDDNFREFIEYKEKLSDVLYFDAPHPKAMAGHPIMKYREPHFDIKENSLQIRNWRNNTIYAEENIPLIAVWMWREYQRQQPLYNSLRVE